MALLHGSAGRLDTKNAGFRPGQYLGAGRAPRARDRRPRAAPDSCRTGCLEVNWARRRFCDESGGRRGRGCRGCGCRDCGFRGGLAPAARSFAAGDFYMAELARGESAIKRLYLSERAQF